MTAEAKCDAAEDAAMLDAVALGSPTTAARAEGVDGSRCEDTVCAEHAAASDAGAARASDASPADEEEAARALAEHNALALAFDDVRAESREGRLVSPARWTELGLVPEHLTDEDFEMLVYEYWEDDESARKEAETERPAPPARKYRTATRAVGVPPIIGRAADDPGADSASNSDDAVSAGVGAEAEGDGSSAAGDAPEADGSAGAGILADARASAGADVLADSGAPAAARASAISGDPADGSDENPFAGLDVPAGFELVQLEGEWCLVETGEEPEPVELEIKTSGIKALIGSHSYYLYDADLMTDVYARWAYLAAEDDPQVTFVECVRQESRVYPRPMPLESLRNAPFRMSVDAIESTWRAVHASGAYPDLERVVASNGDVYFYSTDYLSPVRAAALAEWDAVERYQNV